MLETWDSPELTIRAMLGHASQNVTQDYVHIDEALKLAVRRTSDEIEPVLALGAAKLETMRRPVERTVAQAGGTKRADAPARAR